MFKIIIITNSNLIVTLSCWFFDPKGAFFSADFKASARLPLQTILKENS